MTSLGALGGTGSVGYGINDAGQVTGLAYTTSSSPYLYHAFLYSNGAMTDLGTMGGISSAGYGINSAGQVVGSVLMGHDARDRGINNAFLYSDGTMTNLNTLIDPSSGWTLSEARGINDAGQIVGWGVSPYGGEFHAFLLTPVPEPETYALMLAGLGLIGAVARRRKQSEA